MCNHCDDTGWEMIPYEGNFACHYCEAGRQFGDADWELYRPVYGPPTQFEDWVAKETLRVLSCHVKTAQQVLNDNWPTASIKLGSTIQIRRPARLLPPS